MRVSPGASRFAASMASSSALRFSRRQLHPWVMVWQTRFHDGERAASSGLGFGKPVRVLKQLRQIVQADGHIGMTGPKLEAAAFLC